MQQLLQHAEQIGRWLWGIATEVVKKAQEFWATLNWGELLSSGPPLLLRLGLVLVFGAVILMILGRIFDWIVQAAFLIGIVLLVTWAVVAFV